MSVPRVSIGLPVFNGGDFLAQAITSILNQDYADLELIIGDNNSSDATESICRVFASSDSRVRYYRNDVNLGAAPNYNKTFELARGEYFKWAAHDDECHPAMIRRCVEALDQAPPIVTMVYPLGELIDEHGTTITSPLDRIESRHDRPSKRVANVLRSLQMCDPIFGLYRYEYLRRTRLIGPFFGADNVLLTELALLGEIREVGEVLFRLRAHAKRSMQANRSARARAVWYSTSAGKNVLVIPDWERMVMELLKAVRRSRLPALEKARCCAAVLGTHYGRRFRNAGGRVKRRLRVVLNGGLSHGDMR